MSKILKVGVIGVGGIAGTHFPGWEASPHAELIALSDPAAPILERVAKEQGVFKTYENPADLIADPDIDIIDICTPSAYHAPLSIAALEADKHVICEKPLAPTPDDINRMIEARDKSGKMLMTAQHFRFENDTQALKKKSKPAFWATSITRAVGCCGATASSCGPASSTRRIPAAAPASTSACIFSI